MNELDMASYYTADGSQLLYDCVYGYENQK